jgi:hypothetical protein
VSAETGISHLDQVSVELLLILAFFVTPSKYDGLLQRIECKGRTSQSILPKSQFLHVRKGRTFECVDVWPPQLGGELREHFHPDNA